MMSQAGIIGFFAFARQNLLNVLEPVTEEQARIIPPQFNNNILWNAGHTLLTVENFLFSDTGRNSALPPNYKELFSRGTKPEDWTGDVPALRKIITELTEQRNRVRIAFAEKLDEPITAQYPFQVEPPPAAVGDILSFAVYHEGTHTGSIRALKKMTAQ
jgi:hypothetical protein